MDDAVTKNEWISALADGQLLGHDFAQALNRVATETDAVQCWKTYHLIGDVLRSPELARPDDGGAFLARLRASLELESPCPTPDIAHFTDPEMIARNAVATTASREKNTSKVESANAAVFSWKLVAGMASVAAVAAIGWGAAGQFGATANPTRLAVLPTGSQLAAPAVGGQVVLRDARLDELLNAHKQSGGSSALHMSAGFLRNATYESASR